MGIEASFKFIAKHPAMACICGGILLLLLSPVYSQFALWGGGLIAIGVVLQILWLILFKKI